MIESMCVVCHGPVAQRKRNVPTAITCHGDGGNCRANWWRMTKYGKPLPVRSANLRALHAYRRELMAAQLRLASFLGRYGWLEVG